jgi:hypothetical protein
MIITTSIRTATHRNNPSRIWHLIIHLPERRSHLVGKRARNDHDIGLARGSTEDYTETILIVAGSGKVHHFDGAACKAEGHGPEGSLTRPVGYLVQSRSEIDIRYFNAWMIAGRTYNAYCITPFLPSCEGNGTSRLSLPVTLNGGLPGVLCIVTALAGFDEEEEIAAIDR